MSDIIYSELVLSTPSCTNEYPKVQSVLEAPVPSDEMCDEATAWTQEQLGVHIRQIFDSAVDIEKDTMSDDEIVDMLRAVFRSLAHSRKKVENLYARHQKALAIIESLSKVARDRTDEARSLREQISKLRRHIESHALLVPHKSSS